MNTRGLIELVVLNIGFDLGILSPVLFSMMVVMAVTTTLATSPLVSRLKRHAPPRSRQSLRSGSGLTTIRGRACRTQLLQPIHPSA